MFAAMKENGQTFSITVSRPGCEEGGKAHVELMGRRVRKLQGRRGTGRNTGATPFTGHVIYLHSEMVLGIAADGVVGTGGDANSTGFLISRPPGTDIGVVSDVHRLHEFTDKATDALVKTLDISLAGTVGTNEQMAARARLDGGNYILGDDNDLIDLQLLSRPLRIISDLNGHSKVAQTTLDLEDPAP